MTFVDSRQKLGKMMIIVVNGEKYVREKKEENNLCKFSYHLCFMLMIEKLVDLHFKLAI